MAAILAAMPGEGFAAMSRPHIGIDRLPIRRPGIDSKEAMNCKSCRKRKIKCNRRQPSCEACQVFKCACIYDAVPKKRGPKTDVLEALLKRVNGLEERLKDETQAVSPTVKENSDKASNSSRSQANDAELETETKSDGRLVDHSRTDVPRVLPVAERVLLSRETIAFTDALLDTYFARLHNKPYYILDESNTRQRLRDGHLPKFMINAIHAVSIRHVPYLCGGYNGSVRASQDYAMQSRAEIDVDEPSIDHLQALLLLAMANSQGGKGKKCYMLISHAISMAFALDLHLELPADMRCSSIEREGRRRLFWTCYLMERFTTSGSKRPPLILDHSIQLRFPAWKPYGSHKSVDGNYFPNGSSLPYASGVSATGQGSGAMLVEIVRILGVANKYLAAGGVKGDSHFPWHMQSTISRIRLELDHWGDSTKEAFQSIETLFGQPDSMTLVLCKLVYHLIHCLLYRPFLPVDVSELQDNREEQPWQIEATNLCFMHANAIAELIEIGKRTGIIYWPSFVGFCICTAGTIHAHGVHYLSQRDDDVFTNSADFLEREMAHLSALRYVWAGVQHQLDTLQLVYASHVHLVQALACSPARFSPVFQMEDFFDRYPGTGIDGAHITFTDVSVSDSRDALSSDNGSPMEQVNPQMSYPSLDNSVYEPTRHQSVAETNSYPMYRRPSKRRRTTAGVLHPYPTPSTEHQLDPFDKRCSEETHIDPAAQYPLASQPRQSELSTNQLIANDHSRNSTLTASAPDHTLNPGVHNAGSQFLNQYDPFYGAPSRRPSLDHQMLSNINAILSPGSASGPAEAESDPFLSFLEQLVENDGSDGANELDLFLDDSRNSMLENGVG